MVPCRPVVVGSGTSRALPGATALSGGGTPARASSRRPGAVAGVDLDDDGRGVDQVTQPGRQLPDQVDGIEATGEGRRYVQQPAGLLGRGPGALVFGCRGRRRLGGGSWSPGEGEPHRVPAVGLVPGAPGRGQPRDEGQAATVGGGPPVALPRLGQVQLQRARAAVGDGHGDLVVVGHHRQVERGAGVQHGVLAQLAGQQHDVVDDVRHVAAVPGGTAVRRLGQRVVDHPPNASDRPDVGRKPHPPLESNGHACSLPARRCGVRRAGLAVSAVGLD